MPKVIIDMGLLDHLLIKSHGKFNVVADMKQPEMGPLITICYQNYELS